MPRKPRIHYEGALYHVMVRGNNGERVFAAAKEKQEYINIIKEHKRKYQSVNLSSLTPISHYFLLLPPVSC
ncbi:hypothetical protein QBE52_12190 [Clostridiaceae bacterium 35-E11]